MNTTTRDPFRTRLLAAAAVAVAGFASSVALAAPASAATELPDIEESLVHVWTEYSGFVEYPTADGWIWSERITVGFRCTGWFASDRGHIATAGHCVDPDDGRAALISQLLAEHDAEQFYAEAISNWNVEGYDPGSEIDHTIEVLQASGATDPIIDTWTTAELVDYQEFESGDAALLKVAGITGTTPLAIAAASPEVGAEIVSVGFPGAVRQSFDAQRLGASFMTGTVSSHQVTSRGVPVIEINAQVSGGMSGGPTVDAAGNVIGINSFGIETDAQSFNFVTDTEGLVSFLARNGVTVDQAAAATTATDGASDDAQQGGIVPATSTSSSGDGLGGALILTGGLAAAGAVIVSLVVALVVVLTRRRAPGASIPAQGHVQAPPPVAVG